jgi:hypothetical protein
MENVHGVATKDARLQDGNLVRIMGWLLSVSKTLCDEDREYTIFLGDYRIVSFFVSSTLGWLKSTLPFTRWKEK